MKSPPKALAGISAGSTLLKPLDVGPWSLAHRVVVEPPGRACVRRSDGSPSSEMLAFYREWASLGGLFVAEAAAVEATGPAAAGAAALSSADHANSWRPLVEEVHRQGGIILAQLWHASRPLAAEPIAWSGNGTDDSIETLIDQVRQAAEHAGDAGFDGVELHAAEGSLFHQCLQDHPLELRAPDFDTPSQGTLLIDAVQALASVWGAARVGVRVSRPCRPGRGDVRIRAPLLDNIAGRLAEEGVAFLHVRNTTLRSTARVGGVSPAKSLPDLRIAFPGALLASGGYDVASAERAIDSRLVDAVVLG